MSDEQIYVDPRDTISNDHGQIVEITNDLAMQRLAIVNVVYFGNPKAGNHDWVLIDTGVTGMASSIIKGAENRFGPGARPSAIILTHGHFDHVGTVRELAEHWNVKVYAHELEFPYLNGTQSYPPPDPTVGGGMMSLLSVFYPRGPIDIRGWLHPLQKNDVPGMPGWTWIHTPGHSPGHISLWNSSEKSLIAGDAFITTKQESMLAVFMQSPEIHGPPTYYTPDWTNAKMSVVK